VPFTISGGFAAADEDVVESTRAGGCVAGGFALAVDDAVEPAAAGGGTGG